MKILKKPVRVRVNVKRSIFVATLSRVDSVEDARSFIADVSKEFNDANHNCWAYRVIENSEIVEHSSDAGEPPGSAGFPILNALKERELVNVAAVVTRYFGGVKLGIPGLRKTYTTGKIERAGGRILKMKYGEREVMVEYAVKGSGLGGRKIGEDLMEVRG